MSTPGHPGPYDPSQLASSFFPARGPAAPATSQAAGAAPFTPRAYPADPTMPSAAPAGYVTPASPGNPSHFEPPKTPAQLDSLRSNFFELLTQQIVKAFTGFFLPGGGGALSQLANIAQNIPFVGAFVRAGNQLWNTIREMFTGETGVSGETLFSSATIGRGVLGSIGNPLAAFGIPGQIIQDIVSRFIHIMPHTGALLGFGIAGGIRSGSNTAISGGAVGGWGSPGSTTSANALVSPGFVGSTAVAVAANGWDWNGGAGAPGGPGQL